MSGNNPHKLLLVTAHMAEAKALARALKPCAVGPLPFRYSSDTFDLLVGGEGMEKMASSLRSLERWPYAMALLFGAAGALTDLYDVGMVLQCSWIQSLTGKTLASPVMLDLPRSSLVTVREPVVAPNERQTLYNETGAILVDMEAHAFATEMEERFTPWSVVKMVSDTPARAHTFPFPVEIVTLMDDAAATAVQSVEEVSVED